MQALKNDPNGAAKKSYRKVKRRMRYSDVLGEYVRALQELASNKMGDLELGFIIGQNMVEADHVMRTFFKERDALIDRYAKKDAFGRTQFVNHPELGRLPDFADEAHRIDYNDAHMKLQDQHTDITVLMVPKQRMMNVDGMRPILYVALEPMLEKEQNEPFDEVETDEPSTNGTDNGNIVLEQEAASETTA